MILIQPQWDPASAPLRTRNHFPARSAGQPVSSLGPQDLRRCSTQVLSLASFPTAHMQGTVASLVFSQHASHPLPEGQHNCSPLCLETLIPRYLFGPRPQLLQIFSPKVTFSETPSPPSLSASYIASLPFTFPVPLPTRYLQFLKIFFLFFSCLSSLSPRECKFHEGRDSVCFVHCHSPNAYESAWFMVRAQ